MLLSDWYLRSLFAQWKRWNLLFLIKLLDWRLWSDTFVQVIVLRVYFRVHRWHRSYCLINIGSSLWWKLRFLILNWVFIICKFWNRAFKQNLQLFVCSVIDNLHCLNFILNSIHSSFTIQYLLLVIYIFQTERHFQSWEIELALLSDLISFFSLFFPEIV